MMNASTQIPDPFSLVIFGATGDLTQRKLVPAVFSLFCSRLLPDKFSIVAFARRDKSDDEFREEMRQAVETFARVQPIDESRWRNFAKNIYYHRSEFEDIQGFRSLRERIELLAASCNAPCNCLFYLAVQPGQTPLIVEQLRQAGLAGRGVEGAPWRRIIVEKPFGRDLASARLLNQQLRAVFDENQIFRIDHYLGKETVQNILVFRFANSIFEPLWNQKYVDHVQITVSETVGMEGRGRYYEQAGALRDMVQNHMMHLLCLVAMESPNSLDPGAVRDEKVKVLKALRPIPPECAVNGVVRAQYASGTCLGEEVRGYREEEGVAPDSNTETYVAFQTFVDNWRWSGVPFYLRTGKRLRARVTEIGVHFKSVPQVLFNSDPRAPMQPNLLALRIQPNEGITLRLQIKEPGPGMRIQPLKMDFGYAEAFGKQPPEAYERLLLDAARGDLTLFTRSDEVEAAWSFLTPVIEGCAGQRGIVSTYPAGTWGPKEANDLIAADGRQWRLMRRSTAKDAEPFQIEDD
ncbi:MAG: glucose-6-phosphate dehydrogenase [Planctomycetota bacterium]